MNFKKDMTTYRFPRTLHEAFGVDATTANPIQRFPRSLSILGCAVIWISVTATIVMLMIWVGR